MKTDSQLAQDVADELYWTPEVDSSNVGVIAKDGVVTLTGHLASFAEKYAAEQAVQRVRGVQAIAMEITVDLAADRVRTDADIALAAQRAIEWTSCLPSDAVCVMVEAGHVKLSGQVKWQYQRAAAEGAVRNLMGVVGVTNQIVLGPTVRTLDLEETIRQALARQADLEANNLQVSVDDGEVTLRGTVHSWSARQAIHGAAWSAPGVSAVIDLMRIAD